MNEIDTESYVVILWHCNQPGNHQTTKAGYAWAGRRRYDTSATVTKTRNESLVDVGVQKRLRQTGQSMMAGQVHTARAQQQVCTYRFVEALLCLRQSIFTNEIKTHPLVVDPFLS